MITINSNVNEIKKHLKNMSKKIETNNYRAINKGLTKGRTEIAREVRGVYTKIKLSDVRKSTKIKKANKSVAGEISVKNTMTPIQDSLLRTKKRNKKGTIKVNIKDNKVKVLSMNGKYKPFIMRLKSGKVIVSRRTSDERYPTKQIKTVSIPQMAKNVKVSDKITDNVSKFINDEFIRLMNLGDKIK